MMQLIIPFVWDVVDLFSVFRESLLLSSSRNDPVDFLLFKNEPRTFLEASGTIQSANRGHFTEQQRAHENSIFPNLMSCSDFGSSVKAEGRLPFGAVVTVHLTFYADFIS